MYWNEFDPLRRKAPAKLVRSYSVLIIMKFARIRAFSTTSRRCIFPQMSRRCIFRQKNVNEQLNTIYWYRKGKDKKRKTNLKRSFRERWLIDDLMKRKRIKTVAWTRIGWCVFDDNESRCVAARSHMTNLTQKVERRTNNVSANFWILNTK